jgi:iron complex outermembrane recepter protein
MHCHHRHLSKNAEEREMQKRPNATKTIMINQHMRPIAVAITLILLGLNQTANAQQSSQPAAPTAAPKVEKATAKEAASKDEKKPDGSKLEVLVVTANKRVEKLENVPMAISVLSSEMIERNNVQEVADIVNLSPALTVTYGTTPANNGINMRGIGTYSIGIGVESDVAVIIDDIPIGMQVQAFQDLSDLQRIEILKGPQSTLFGKSAIAGAIVITTKPITGAMIGTATSLFTSDNESRVALAYGGEVSDKFAFRISASHTDYPGNVNNLANGTKINGASGKTFIGKFSWRPTKNLDIDFSPRYNDSTSNTAYVLTSFTNFDTAFYQRTGSRPVSSMPATVLLRGITPSANNVDVRYDDTTGQRQTSAGAGLRVNYAFDSGATLTSISSYNKYIAYDSRDQDHTDFNTLATLPVGTATVGSGINDGYVQFGSFDVRSKTQEVRLTSKDSGDFRFVTGLWYAKNTIERVFTRGVTGIALTTPAKYFTDTYNKNIALYGQGTWEFSPGYTLLAGARLNREVSGYNFLGSVTPTGPFVPNGSFSSLDNTRNATTGKLSLQRQFTTSLTAYIMASTGYKGLAYDLTSGLNAATAAQQPVRAETATSYEIGAKGNFFDDRMTVNLAVFDTKFKDYQQNSGSFLPNTATFITRLDSIPGVQTKGVEVDVAAMISPNLVLNGAMAYTEATVTSFVNGPCYTVANSPNSGQNAECRVISATVRTADLSGARMPNAPKWKVNLGAKYDVILKDYSFNGFVTGSVRYQSDVITNINQDPSLAAPGRTITNIGFGIRDKKNAYRLTVFINNLFDKQYANTGFVGYPGWSSAVPGTGNSTWTPARDAFRYYGVRLDMKF